MSKRIRDVLATAAALALAGPAAPAVAGPGGAMGQLIDVLRADGTISEQAYEALQAALAADAAERAREVERAAALASAAVRDQVQREIDESVGEGRVVFDRRNLELRDESKGFELSVRGRLHVDSVWYDEDQAELASGGEVRRVRLDVRGKVWRDWNFFSGLELGGRSILFRGMNITYTGFEKFNVQAGYLRQPFGMDDLTSSNNTTFMERANVSDVLVPGRSVGVALSGSADHWSSKGGVFWSGDPDGGDGAGLVDMDGSWTVAARQTFAPWNAPRRVLHLGVASAYSSGGDIGEARYRMRPGTHLTDVRFVDTGTIEDVERSLFYSAELAGSLGPFFFQGEYIGARLSRHGMPTLDLDGWYAQASWLLTGESRPYYASRGVFGAVSPRRRFDPREGGAGAWEVGVRYSTVDLNSEEIEGGEQELVTVGLNWYPNPNVRFMVNYAKMLDVDRRATIFDDDRPASVGLRSQITW
ncbi:MAG TPA: porin [Myxococcota bacterium]|nr:porin [Myxococcota bacterium]